jgi:D-lactate dehydrogenase
VLEEEHAVQDEVELLLLNRIEDSKLRVLLENHTLVNMPNVILTPHVAFNPHEAMEEIWRVTAENVQKFLGGTPPRM